MNIEILFALQALGKITKTPIQQSIQSNYLNKSYRKVLVATFKKNIVLKYLYFLEIFRIFFILILKQKMTGHNNSIIGLSSTQNQERQIQYIRDIISNKDMTTLYIRGNEKLSIINILNIKWLFHSFLSSLKLYRVLYKKHDAIDLKNNILFMCMYSYSKLLLKNMSPEKIIVANDHSALPLGFAGAARQQNITTIYIQHAHVTSNMPRLRFNLAILDGKSALNTYKGQGNISNTAIAYRGIEGIERPMNTSNLKSDTPLTIGIFTNICDKQNLYNIIDDLLSTSRIQKIIIREHPAFPLNLSKSKIPDCVELSKNTTLWEDAEKCDLIVGGNSSFHLSVLKYGIPTIIYNSLDDINYDYYGFIKGKICYEEPDLKNLNFKDIAYFYENKKWIDHFQYFDAAYKNNKKTLNNKIKNYLLNETTIIGNNK